jgi:hypothetical protein
MMNALLTMIGLAAMTVPTLAQHTSTIISAEVNAGPQTEVPEGAFEIALPNLVTTTTLPGEDHVLFGIEQSERENTIVRTVMIVRGDSAALVELPEQARLGRDVITFRGPVRALPQRPNLRIQTQVETELPDLDEATTKGRRGLVIVRRFEPAKKTIAPQSQQPDEARIDDVREPVTGEFARPEPDVPSAAEMLEAATAGYSLANATPNPVSAGTSISFTLPQSGRTKLAIFDNTGREVAVLADEVLDAGSHTRMFDASALPAGLYLYRLSSGSFAETKTMTVVH